MSRILFVDIIYGTPRGHSYVNKDLIKILKEEQHEIGICKSLNNKIMNDFILPDKIFNNVSTGLEMGKDQFLKVLDEFKPDFCIFNEYSQWQKHTYDKLDICKARGIKTIGYLVWEKLDWTMLDHYKKYTKIISPSGFQTKLMRRKGLYNTVHIKWGAFFEEIDNVVRPTRNPNKVTFYHCAGSGGVGDRKNTDKVIEAYKLMQTPNTNLIITHLSSKVFSRSEIISFIKGADVLLNPSKWDTIGLNNIEANICGIPVITTDAPPMNELIKDNVNGLLVNAKKVITDKVTCPAYDVDVKDLAKKMAICTNDMILRTLQSNARVFAETNFDWNKNKSDIQKLFR